MYDLLLYEPVPVVGFAFPLICNAHRPGLKLPEPGWFFLEAARDRTVRTLSVLYDPKTGSGCRIFVPIGMDPKRRGVFVPKEFTSTAVPFSGPAIAVLFYLVRHQLFRRGVSEHGIE